MKWVFTLLCLFLMTLCLLLSHWQWHRYHFKKELLAASQKHMHEEPILFSEIENNPSDFQTVKAEGYYLDTLTILIQNQPHDGKIGFSVITPFKMPGEDKLVLVDRGWVPDYHQENILGKQWMKGYIKLLNERPFILGKNILDEKTFPLIVQRIDVDELERITQRSFFPFVIRLDPAAQHGFTRVWEVTTVPPERHLGYAIQWLSFAVILLIGYLFFMLSRYRDGQ